jgi:IS30 family transposase
MNAQDQTIWHHYRQGRSARQIGRDLEISHRAVQRRLNKHGGMRPAERRRATGRLSFDEREEISRGIAAGLSANSIASRMERPPSTISREIARNGGRDAYRAVDAEQAAWDRARRPKPTKLAEDATLRNDVVEGLAKKWSPEQIAGRLAVDYPDDPDRRISFESIYRAVYLPAKSNMPDGVRICLRTRRRLRRSKAHRGGKKQRRGQLKDITLIAERPTAIDDRREFGHWEGDLVLGTSNSAIATLVERTSRYTEIVKLGGLKSPVVVDAVSAHMQQMRTAVLVTLTWDQGKEMAEHKRLHAETGVPI